MNDNCHLALTKHEAQALFTAVNNELDHITPEDPDYWSLFDIQLSLEAYLKTIGELIS